MPKLEPIKVLTVDEVPMNVAELSETVKQLVAIFDDWNQQESDARSHLMMVSAAKDSLSRQIIQQIRSDKAAAEQAAAAEIVAATEQAPANDPVEAISAAPVVGLVAKPAEAEADDEAEDEDEIPEDAVIMTGDASE